MRIIKLNTRKLLEYPAFKNIPDPLSESVATYQMYPTMSRSYVDASIAKIYAGMAYQEDVGVARACAGIDTYADRKVIITSLREIHKYLTGLIVDKAGCVVSQAVSVGTDSKTCDFRITTGD